MQQQTGSKTNGNFNAQLQGSFFDYCTYHALNKIDIKYFFILFQPPKQWGSSLMTRFLIVMYLVHCIALWTITLCLYGSWCLLLSINYTVRPITLFQLTVHHRNRLADHQWTGSPLTVLGILLCSEINYEQKMNFFLQEKRTHNKRNLDNTAHKFVQCIHNWKNTPFCSDTLQSQNLQVKEGQQT